MSYGLFDARFKYVPSTKTDISKTFARIRKEMAEKARLQAEADAEAKAKVRQIKKLSKA